MLHIPYIDVEEINPKHDRFKVFRFTLPKASVNTALDPNLWPSGIKVAVWTKPRNDLNKYVTLKKPDNLVSPNNSILPLQQPTQQALGHLPQQSNPQLGVIVQQNVPLAPMVNNGQHLQQQQKQHYIEQQQLMMQQSCALLQQQQPNYNNQQYYCLDYNNQSIAKHSFTTPQPLTLINNNNNSNTSISRLPMSSNSTNIVNQYANTANNKIVTNNLPTTGKENIHGSKIDSLNNNEAGMDLNYTNDANGNNN